MEYEIVLPQGWEVVTMIIVGIVAKCISEGHKHYCETKRWSEKMRYHEFLEKLWQDSWNLNRRVPNWAHLRRFINTIKHEEE